MGVLIVGSVGGFLGQSVSWMVVGLVSWLVSCLVTVSILTMLPPLFLSQPVHRAVTY